MKWNLRKSGLAVASVSAALVTLPHCNAGRLKDLLDKRKDIVERRMPACDCSYGHFETTWRPWGTCDVQPVPPPGSGIYVPSRVPQLPTPSPSVSSPEPVAVPPYVVPNRQPVIIDGQGRSWIEMPSTTPGSSQIITTPRDGTLVLPPDNAEGFPQGIQRDQILTPDRVPPVGPTPQDGVIHSPATPGPRSLPVQPNDTTPAPLLIEPGPVPADKSIRIPEPPKPSEESLQESVPAPGVTGTLRHRRVVRGSQWQPTSHSQVDDEIEWRVMPGFYQPQQAVTTRARLR